MLVVPVTDADRLAAACSLVRVPATVVPLEGAGAAVVPDDAAAGSDAAQRLSRVIGQADVMLFVRRGDHVDAERWRAGALAETPAAGMALACLPDAAEKLVLAPAGSADGELPGAVSSRGLSRFAAARTALAGSPAEAAWAAKVQRWDRVASLVVLALLTALVLLEAVRTAGGAGSPVVLGLALGLLLLLGFREYRRRRAP